MNFLHVFETLWALAKLWGSKLDNISRLKCWSPELSIHKDEPRLPGPDVYSLSAARVKQKLLHKGPQTQSTVSMSNMKGERGSFLRDRMKEDYDQNYFHVI